jgi:hypothetical protein
MVQEKYGTSLNLQTCAITRERERERGIVAVKGLHVRKSFLFVGDIVIIRDPCITNIL